MNSKLIDLALDILAGPEDARPRKKTPSGKGMQSIKKVNSKVLSYTNRHKDQWFRPEYDLDRIQIAQDSDTYIFKSIQKKVNRFMIAGHEFHGKNPESVAYVQRRIAEMELASNTPWKILLKSTAHDLTRFSNCMWVKVRDSTASTGKRRVDLTGMELDPVAGYFLLPFECLEFKTKPNGEIRKVLQRMPNGETKEFLPRNLIHFYSNKKPGFAIGTPELIPALDDVVLLRRMEDLAQELVETNLFPVYHYTVGTDEFPETFTQEGIPETDIVKRKLEYMPSGGIYVSDHRHKIQVLGSESKALRIDFYLTYFKARVFAGLGVSSVDMGEGDTANRSTAGALSKALIQDVEALQEIMKTFLEFYVINELLWEGGFDPLDPEQKVEIRFGIIDREEQTKVENQAQQLVHGNLITVAEGRKRLGYPAYRDEDYDGTFQKRFSEPLALVNLVAAGTAASKVLAENQISNLTPEAVEHEEEYAKKAAEGATKASAASAPSRKQGRPPTNSASTSSNRKAASLSQPSNQSGERGAPKYSKDLIDLVRAPQELLDLLQPEYEKEVDRIHRLAKERADMLNCSLDTVYANLSYRFMALEEKYTSKVKDLLES